MSPVCNSSTGASPDCSFLDSLWRHTGTSVPVQVFSCAYAPTARVEQPLANRQCSVSTRSYFGRRRSEHSAFLSDERCCERAHSWARERRGLTVQLRSRGCEISRGNQVKTHRKQAFMCGGGKKNTRTSDIPCHTATYVINLRPKHAE